MSRSWGAESGEQNSRGQRPRGSLGIYVSGQMVELKEAWVRDEGRMDIPTMASACQHMLLNFKNRKTGIFTGMETGVIFIWSWRNLEYCMWIKTLT